VLFATADDDVAAAILGHTAPGGHRAIRASTWEALLVTATHDTARLIIVDPTLPAMQVAALEALANALPGPPEIRSWETGFGPFRAISSPQLTRWLTAEGAHPLDSTTRDWLRYAGLGSEALADLRILADNPLPIRIVGERGTGKERVARLVHRLIWPDESNFIVVATNARWDASTEGGRAGTIYIESGEKWAPEDVDRALRWAEGAGWRVMAGFHRRNAEYAGWQTRRLIPLRERPADIEPLFSRYLDTWRKRLNRPRLAVAPALMERMQAYGWPQNLRELETFAVEVATATHGRHAGLQQIPEKLLARLTERPDDEAAFEATLAARLRPLIARHHPDVGLPSLHATVIDATERVLFQLALEHCGGNQKAAAEFLGVARNTLRERLARWAAKPSPG
jgi:hypothetical protein